MAAHTQISGIPQPPDQIVWKKHWHMYQCVRSKMFLKEEDQISMTWRWGGVGGGGGLTFCEKNLPNLSHIIYYDPLTELAKTWLFTEHI